MSKKDTIQAQGGRARADALTPERRKEIAVNAINVRWGKKPLKQNKKDLARQRLNNAVKTGTLKRGKCAMCSSMKTEGHHEDYNKPLVVVWLCRKHHDKTHLDKKHTQ